jgi:hypothetical protein
MSGSTAADVPGLASLRSVRAFAGGWDGAPAPRPLRPLEGRGRPETARRLWSVSEQLTAARFPEIQKQ